MWPPGLLARERPALAQHHRRDRLALAAQVRDGRVPRANQVTHGLVRLVRHPHRGKFAGTQQACELLGVAPVGLDPVTRLARDQRRRNDGARVTKLGQLPIEPVAGWTCLVTEVQPSVPLLQLGHQTAHALRVSADLAEVSDLALPSVLSDRHGVPGFGHVQSHENLCMLIHGSSSCAEDRPAPAGNPR